MQANGYAGRQACAHVTTTTPQTASLSAEEREFIGTDSIDDEDALKAKVDGDWCFLVVVLPPPSSQIIRTDELL